MRARTLPDKILRFSLYAQERLSLLLPPSSGSPQTAAAPKQTVGLRSSSSSNGPPPPPPAPPPKTEPILDQVCVAIAKNVSLGLCRHFILKF